MSIERQQPETQWSTCEMLLRLSVQAAVPLLIAELQKKGGPNNFHWKLAQNFADELGERGDILQFSEGTRKGETVTIFSRFAYTLSIMAFAPGGVRFAGMHFEALPQTTQNGPG